MGVAVGRSRWYVSSTFVLYRTSISNDHHVPWHDSKENKDGGRESLRSGRTLSGRVNCALTRKQPQPPCHYISSPLPTPYVVMSLCQLTASCASYHSVVAVMRCDVWEHWRPRSSLCLRRMVPLRDGELVVARRLEDFSARALFSVFFRSPSCGCGFCSCARVALVVCHFVPSLEFGSCTAG